MIPLLNNYYRKMAPPVAIYLRINDWSISKDEATTKSAFTRAESHGKINKESLKKCISFNQNIDINKINEINNYIDKASQVKFKDVFDPYEFKDNDVLAHYMAIPQYLEQQKSIMLITYGYSGVGKTYTVFGNLSKNKPGVLQSSLKHIKNKKKIFYRAYELYGLAVPYQIYWNKTIEEYYHYIYAYTYDDNNNISCKKHNSKNMMNYINMIDDTKNTNNQTFYELNEENLNDFSTIVGKIDDIRRNNNGTIKKTINNDESSRSIMFYDFKIELDVDNTKKDGNNTTKSEYVYLVIMDLPGKEHIIKTYINIDDNNTANCIKKNDNIQHIDSKLLKTMAYCSPLSLALDSEIANIIVNTFDTFNNNKKIENQIENQIVLELNLYGYKIPKPQSNSQIILYNNSISIIQGLDKTPSDANYNRYKNNGIRKYALEIMRNIIKYNHFDLLTEIYNKIFTFNNKNVTPKCSSHESYAITPFEGYYINENITGIITTLLQKLNIPINFITPQKYIYNGDIYNNFVSNRYFNNTTTSLSNLEITQENQDAYSSTFVFTARPNVLENTKITSQKDLLKVYSDNRVFLEAATKNEDKELIGQTYFFRRFIYSKAITDDSTKLSPTDFNIAEYYKNNTEWNGKPFSYWFTSDDIYDYNKAYKIKDAPIKNILSTYFDKIGNFYVFYVVSNEKPEKCDKQIKFISDSYDFLNALSKFDTNKKK